MLGYLTYKVIYATVQVTPQSVTVSQKSKTMGISSKEKVQVLQRKEIKNVHLVNQMDTVDGIYVGLFCAVGLLSAVFNLSSEDPNWIGTLICFGIGLLCFFTGWGKKILIWTRDPKPMKVQTETNQQEEELVSLLQEEV